jgi:coenzyme F420-reducing hydrogenase alpha subunit
MPKKINLEHISKIEGHAKLHVKIAGGRVEKAKLEIIEGARYFEGILRERKYNDISHIASRICGVCSVVHTIASLKSIENAFGVAVSEQTRQLREVLNIGGIIQSHALHLYFLTLPDYAGAESALAMAKTNSAIIERALRLKRLGNKIVFTIAGRDVHPIACVLGGFSRAPEKAAVDELLDELIRCKKDALDTVELFMGLKYPDVSAPVPHFALTGGSYFDSDTIVRCEGGICFQAKDYRQHFKEYLREGSTAEFATQEGKSYFVGALARVCNKFDLLSNEAKQYARKIADEKANPFMNVPAQAIEILEGISRCIVILSNLEIKPEQPKEFSVVPCNCDAISACEAPRGILFHRYAFDGKGYCTIADITTPTTQNLQYMEETIRAYLQSILDKNPVEIKQEIEKLIRAFDPCISCSTHFLEMEWESD